MWASLGLLVPRALGVGYDVIDDALAGRLALGTLAALAIGKLVIWWLALASGTSGGTLAPILLISSCAGGLVGQLLHDVNPAISAGAFALVAMAATFGAATRAPFAAIVFVFELTRDYDAILPLMLATVLAEVVGRATLPQSLMTEKLARRRVVVPGDLQPDVMASTNVRDVMSTPVATIPATTSIDAALDRVLEVHHHAFPVVDEDGRCIGMVTPSDLIAADGDGPGTVARFCGDVVAVGPDDLVADGAGTHARRARRPPPGVERRRRGGRDLHPHRRAARPTAGDPRRAAPDRVAGSSHGLRARAALAILRR